MLVLGMVFGVLVAGPLLVLGALALANNERAMERLVGPRRRGQPAAEGTVADVAQPDSGDGGALADANAATDGAHAR